MVNKASAKLAAIIIAAATVYMIGNGRVALWDRDEPRNAQAARQMLKSGDWVVPRFLDQVRTAKPVFTYWCQASAMKLLGDNAQAARLPSALAMTMTLIVLAIVLIRRESPRLSRGLEDASDFERERAIWTVFILATSALVIAWCARNALTDAMQLLWITIAQLCLYAIWRGHASWPIVIIFAMAVGLAGLTKGPVILGVQGLTVAAIFLLSWTERVILSEAKDLNRSNAKMLRFAQHDTWVPVLKFLCAVIIIAGIAGPWIYLVNHRAPGFIGTSFSRDVIRRTFELLEQHKGPPGYYLIMIWPMFFPWSLLLPATVALAWKHRNEPNIRFAIAATIGPWLMFECVQTKLPHYLLPIFPPLAFLTADALVRCIRGEYHDLVTRGFIVAAGIWATLVIVIGFAPWLAAARFIPLPMAAGAAVTIAAIVYAIGVFVPFQLHHPARAAATMGIGMMALMAIIFGWYLPSAWFLRLPMHVADSLHASGATPAQTKPGDVQMIGYKEPSLAFYQGGTIREQSENYFLVTHEPSEWPTFLVIHGDVWQRMPASVTEKLRVIAVHRGLDYADRGRIVDVFIVRKK